MLPNLEQTPQDVRWYHQWWAVALLAILVLVLVVGGVVGFLTLYYFRELKAGRTPAIGSQVPYGFSSSTVTPVYGQPTVSRAELETADDPERGAKNAPVTVVEFVDFKCPNCQAAAPILANILAKYPTKVRLILRDFPAESLHPGATQLAQVGYCAFQQGKVWQFHDVIFNNQEALPEVLTVADIDSIAANIGADSMRLQQCATSQEAEREVYEDYITGVSAGVIGTPTFFINGEKFEGVIPEEAWVRYLDAIK